MEYSLLTTVYTTLEVVGFHYWPNAPEEVGYLSNDHRHLFKIHVELSVEENDREVEFHMLKRRIEGFLMTAFNHTRDRELLLGPRSCEALGEQILTWLRANYPGRDWYEVIVSEDGENGAAATALRVREGLVVHGH